MTAEPTFPPGTFAPDPRPAAVAKMLAAQYRLELTLLLRNGEQLLLTMFIPITLLVGGTVLPLGPFGEGHAQRVTTLLPVIMALAVIATGFTGQAIAVAFDRRYGALKRLGATALPVWGVVTGKSLSVVTVVFLQTLLLGSIAAGLGWRPTAAGLALGGVVIALGTVCFAALGLLLGGSLRAEIVLAVANLMWFVFGGFAALTVETELVPPGLKWLARLTPSGAFTEALAQALTVSVDWFGIVVVLVWATLAGFGAVRWFRFS
ncbi:ABC transporter permease [Mycobacterium sp. M1]|uniref:ABC transporter permease n=1 Tax=Mycolicibacter acidiphilus TaxID=2835306 RepID=A0ABS5RDJ4_9MYCO|nr:ABC transporter permease [Mycolicibacter acidiphilus]MBS9532244.1 ABC transporter permease [Mycolicibacter acidiphilus]